jgi:hypothetical protein
MDDREEATWVSDAVEAGRECRVAHAALSKWALNPPGVK